MKKSWIYIDGRNFEIWILNLIWADLNKEFNKIYNFNLNSFFENISNNSEIVVKNYYRWIPKSNLFRKEIVKEVGIFANYLVKTGLKLFKWHFTYQKAEKWVDVRIALDLVRDARDKKINIIYLFSNDTDLIEAVKDVKTHWVKIFHCVFNIHNWKWYKSNNALSVNSDKRLILNKQILESLKK